MKTHNPTSYGVITRNRSEASYMLEWCYDKSWLPPGLSLNSISSFPYVFCLDFERETAMWTNHLDRAMEYKEFSEFIIHNHQ